MHLMSYFNYIFPKEIVFLVIFHVHLELRKSKASYVIKHFPFRVNL